VVLQVSACACEALDELLKYPIHLAPLAAELVLKMFRWYASRLPPRKRLLLKFGVELLSICGNHVHTFDAVGRGHVAAAGSIIYSRVSCTRRAIALVASASFSYLVFDIAVLEELK